MLDPPDDADDYDATAQHIGLFETPEKADKYGAMHCEVTYRIKTVFSR